MKTTFLIITTFLIFQSTQCYILFTANMEDVHALSKQLATSPLADQLSKIWRRAANQFQKELMQNRRRGDNDEDKADAYTKRVIKYLVAFSKEMGYLGPIKRALDTIDPK